LLKKDPVKYLFYFVRRCSFYFCAAG